MKFLSKLLVIIAVLFIFSFYIWGHGMTNWKVPEENKRVNNSLSTDENSISRGKELYKKKCIDCHGENGDGKGSMADELTVKPSNFNNNNMMSMMTDGEIFYKISKGNQPMPQWEKKLTENERWDLVNYIKTFAK